MNIFINNNLRYKRIKTSIVDTSEVKLNQGNTLILTSQTDTIVVMIQSLVKDVKLDRVLTIGNTSTVNSRHSISDFMTIIAIGATFVFGLYFLISYFIRFGQLEILAISLFNILMSLKIFVSSETFSQILFTGISASALSRINDTLYLLAALAFIYFVDNLFKEDCRKHVKQYFMSAILLFEIFVFILPLKYYGTLRVVLFVFILLFAVYIFSTLFKAVKNRREGSTILLDSFIVIFAGTINDFLLVLGVIDTQRIIPITIVFFILFQAVFFSIQQNRQIAKSEAMMETLKVINQKNTKFNEASSKFVPVEFLHYLKKETITDIKLGDYQEFNMTVLFIDIRGFTKMSESLTPHENFAFLNNYLSVISPSISKYNGFIDKYIGDAVMALFPKSAEDAIDAALDIKNELLEYNIGRAKARYEPIKIGAGIHTGNLIMGTIGNESRMETTVISDAVNVSSRLEHATKFYGESILISDDVYKNLDNIEKYVTREIDFVKLRGKTHKTTIYSVINDDDRFDDEYLVKYNSALKEFQENNFSDALYDFKKLVDENCFDKVAQIYRDRCRYADISGAPEDWGGFYDIV